LRSIAIIFTVAEQFADKDLLHKGMSGGSLSVIYSTHCIIEAILEQNIRDDNDVSKEFLAVSQTNETYFNLAYT
jgi:hypothetical protein